MADEDYRLRTYRKPILLILYGSFLVWILVLLNDILDYDRATSWLFPVIVIVPLISSTILQMAYEFDIIDPSWIGESAEQQHRLTTESEGRTIPAKTREKYALFTFIWVIVVASLFYLVGMIPAMLSMVFVYLLYFHDVKVAVLGSGGMYVFIEFVLLRFMNIRPWTGIIF